MIRGVSGLSVDYLTSPTVPHHSDDDDDDSNYDDDDSDYDDEGACCKEFSVQFNSHHTQQI